MNIDNLYSRARNLLADFFNVCILYVHLSSPSVSVGPAQVSERTGTNERHR